MTSARRRPSRPTPPDVPRTGASRPIGPLRSRVVLKLRRPFALAVPALIALSVPATAGAVCAQSPLADLARTTPVVVTATAEAGPIAQNGIGLLSPARFHVIAYDQGQGPAEIKVQTALTKDASGGLVAGEDGVNPRAGQTWRLWGTLGPDGVLQTSTCLGSTLMVHAQAPTVAVGARTTSLRKASFAGVARSGALPTVTVARGTKAVLQVPASEANVFVPPALARSLVTVRITHGATTTTLNARWSASDGLLGTKLAAPASGTSTVVVITRAASYALRLRAG